MKEVGIFEAKAKLSELCTQVEEGGAEYVVTRRGRPVARLTRVVTKREDSVDLLTRMAQTNAEYGKIPEDETDFPDVWMDRNSKRTDPFEDEA